MASPYSLKALKLWYLYLKRNPCGIKWLFKYYHSTKRPIIEQQLPWMTFDAVEYLQNSLKNNLKIFEWGSGASTLFLSRFSKELISIEYDAKWYYYVKEQVKKYPGHIDLKLIEPETMPMETPPLLPDYKDNKTKFQNKCWKSYVTEINNYPDNYFDLIIIDGRSRPSCIFHAPKKINKNGIIVLDNSERQAYKSALKLLNDFKSKKFWGPVVGGGFSETTVYFK